MLDYKTLTKEEQLEILRYLWGEYALVNIGHYSRSQNAPKPNPDPHHVLLSCMLGFDFTELYNSSLANNVCQNFKNDGVWWFIGDNLEEIIWGEFRAFKEKPKKIKTMYEDIKNKVVLMYDQYKECEKEYIRQSLPPVPTELEIVKQQLEAAEKAIHEEYKIRKMANMSTLSPLYEYIKIYRKDLL